MNLWFPLKNGWMEISVNRAVRTETGLPHSEKILWNWSQNI
ncbi:MAG TPA: hypothetical protein PK303_09135 [bacterium]|nr:hypothetical protein [bacterium]